MHVIDFTPPGPLPVDLKTFRAIPESDFVKLDWVTELEINSNMFVLEHSLDGYQYDTIDLIPAAGFSDLPNRYHYIHRNAGPGRNYYRLTQWDFDNQKTSFEIQLVDLTAPSKSEPRLLNNPGSDSSLGIAFPYHWLGKTFTLELFDASGLIIQRSPHTANQQYWYQFLPDLNMPGVYIIKLTDFQGNTHNYKYLRQ